MVCAKDGLHPCAPVYKVLDVIVNLTRSVPFLILVVAIIPFTRLIVGTSIGSTAMIVPLVIAAAPFVARLVESSLLELDRGIIEAAQSMGASNLQIIWKVMLTESRPSLLNGATIAITTILGYTAMAVSYTHLDVYKRQVFLLSGEVVAETRTYLSRRSPRAKKCAKNSKRKERLISKRSS